MQRKPTFTPQLNCKSGQNRPISIMVVGLRGNGENGDIHYHFRIHVDCLGNGSVDDGVYMFEERNELLFFQRWCKMKERKIEEKKL